MGYMVTVDNRKIEVKESTTNMDISIDEASKKATISLRRKVGESPENVCVAVLDTTSEKSLNDFFLSKEGGMIAKNVDRIYVSTNGEALIPPYIMRGENTRVITFENAERNLYRYKPALRAIVWASPDLLITNKVIYTA